MLTDAILIASAEQVRCYCEDALVGWVFNYSLDDTVYCMMMQKVRHTDPRVNVSWSMEKLITTTLSRLHTQHVLYRITVYRVSYVALRRTARIFSVSPSLAVAFLFDCSWHRLRVQLRARLRLREVSQPKKHEGDVVCFSLFRNRDLFMQFSVTRF